MVHVHSNIQSVLSIFIPDSIYSAMISPAARLSALKDHLFNIAVSKPTISENFSA